MKSTNITWHNHQVTKEDREKILGQKATLIWLTGLSASGKSTIAMELQKTLTNKGKLAYVLDGDNVRHGLNSDLGFSAEDRFENIRRISEVSKLFVDAGVIVITSFISPYRKDRDSARQGIPDDFIEVFIKCDIEECERRDPKSLYKKAREGLIKDFTGISAPYEPPLTPEVVVDTSDQKVQESVDVIVSYLKEKGKI